MNIDLARRFRGIERLYGLQNTERIKRAHICVIGVGGVGSWVVEALARSGIGALTLIDLDQIAESNVNRQIMALTSQLGRAKVTVLRNRVYDINPAAQVEVIEDFVETDNYQEFFQRSFDFVIDAIDNLKVKAFLADYFVKKGQAFVVAGAADEPLLQEQRGSRQRHAACAHLMGPEGVLEPRPLFPPDPLGIAASGVHAVHDQVLDEVRGGEGSAAGVEGLEDDLGVLV
ncbi:MAG: hypothetical protein DI620_00415, partial [Haemophilus parainfluenzae]